jgi:serine/threonine-protein kinase
MLIAEARLSALLHHPGIVQVYEFGQVGGEYYLAMEYVDGYDLTTLLRHCAKSKQLLSPALACYIAHEVAGALGYAHALNDDSGQPLEIVHRDVSPTNLMITRLGQVKLLDFGIAKAVNSVRDERTRTGTLKGKLSYMSPEQADGEKIDHRTDIFALGVVLWEGLTHRRLFRGKDDLHTLRLVRETKVPPPSQLRPEVSPAMDAVVLKMLARLPADRFTSGEEVMAALAPICHDAHADAQALRRFLDDVGPIPHRPVPLLDASATARNSVEMSLDERATFGESSSDVEATVTTPNGELGPLPKEHARRMRHLGLLAALVGTATAAVRWLGMPGVPANLSKPSAARLAAARATPSLATQADARSQGADSKPEMVWLHVQGPAGAALLVDGKRVANVPADLPLPKQAGQREVTVRASGFFPWTQRLPADQERTIKATPRRVARPTAHAKRTLDDVDLVNPFAR